MTDFRWKVPLNPEQQRGVTVTNGQRIAALAVAIGIAGPVAATTTSAVINTVAGNGTSGFSGDNGAATAAELYSPGAVAVDSVGNFYIAEPLQNRVRKVTLSSGLISTVAGGGGPGYAGDGGPAAGPNVKLNRPSGVAVDYQGNLFIADTSNNVIRMVAAATGLISTVAGTTTCNPTTLVCTSGYSGDNQPAVSATFNGPTGVAVDGSGGVYVADAGNWVIREFYPGQNIYTIAGNNVPTFGGDGMLATQASFCSPTGVAVDVAGTVYVADGCNQRIRRFIPGYLINTIAGGGTSGRGDGGPATSASLIHPTGLAADPLGNVYIADYGDERIRVVNAAGTISTLTGTGTAGYSGDGGAAAAATINLTAVTTQATWVPQLAVDGWGAVYIPDSHNHRIRAVQPSIATVAGNGSAGFGGDGGPASGSAVELYSPRDAVADASGNLYIADNSNNRVRKIDTSGNITTFAGGGTTPGGSDGYGDGGPANQAILSNPQRVCVELAGNVYIADYGHNLVRVVNPGGIISVFAGGGVSTGNLGDGGAATNAVLSTPYGIAIDPSGNVYIADAGNNRVRVVSPQGLISTFAGGGAAGLGDNGPATSAQLGGPQGVAADQYGNIYIADTNNNRIRRVDRSNSISTWAGTGVAGFGGDWGDALSANLNSPRSVAVDALGNLYIGDEGNNRIRKITSIDSLNNRLIYTVVGNGSAAYGGDGGPATAASIDAPRGVGVDQAGNLYFADTTNQRIRVVSGIAAAAPVVTATLTAVYPGQTTTLSVSPGAGLGPYEYQWFQLTSGNISYPISGSNSATLTVLPMSLPASYRVLISGPDFSEYSPTITITLPTSGGGGAVAVPLPPWALGALAVLCIAIGSRRRGVPA